MHVAINPNEQLLGKVNAILRGRNTRYYVGDYSGPLSIKTIVNGSGVWETREGRFALDRDSYLVLNRRQPYSLTIDSHQPTETFCVFFRDGFVEDAWRARTSGHAKLLDDPFADPPPLGFFERLHAHNGGFGASLQRLRQHAITTDPSLELLEDGFASLANVLINQRSELHRELARVPAVKTSTREELYRRLTKARSMIEASLDQPLNLAKVASTACLSVFHLHRAFRESFAETPHEYVVRRRIERASRLLRETEKPVTLVCLESGFQSLGSFSTLFRKRLGVSPSDYRNMRGV